MLLTRRWAALIALGANVAVYAAAPKAGVDEFLDENTGTTVTVVREPLTFALERSTLAAHARDYVSLTAVEVDRSGQTKLYMVGYFWSTIDRRKGTLAQTTSDKVLELLADGRSIRLNPDATQQKDLMAGKQLLAPGASHYEQASYPVTLEMLRYIAGSRHLVLRFAVDSEDDEDSERESYEIWTDARGALKAFAQRISPAR